MNQSELIPHLFRTEFANITAVLNKRLGLGQIQMAEDLVSETFVAALDSWPYSGVPDNPRAWLYKVAQNKLINAVKRKNLLEGKVLPEWIRIHPDSLTDEWSDAWIADSSLEMMFALCEPELSPESQIGLILRYLCGFGVEEIAKAFSIQAETVQKRLQRAKARLASKASSLEFPAMDELPQRIDSVLYAIYLLFSEGYHSESKDEVIREELCFEALRLNRLLIGKKESHLPRVLALQALMSFQASRLQARKDSTGDLVLYHDQDPSKWNQDLILQGMDWLRQASVGNQLSRFHLEASIAYWYTRDESHDNKWEHILYLFNQLLILEYNPVAALNRTYAYYKVHGANKAIQEAEKLKLYDNLYYHSLLGFLYKDINTEKSRSSFTQALDLVKTSGDRQTILKYLSM